MPRMTTYVSDVGGFYDRCPKCQKLFCEHVVETDPDSMVEPLFVCPAEMVVTEPSVFTYKDTADLKQQIADGRLAPDHSHHDGEFPRR